MDPEEGGGSPMQGRMMGIPIWVWVAGIAVLAYFVFRHYSSAGGSATGGGATSTGGGGTASSGTTRIQRGAIQIRVIQGSNPQPRPPVRRREKGMHEHRPPVKQGGGGTGPPTRQKRKRKAA